MAGAQSNSLLIDSMQRLKLGDQTALAEVYQATSAKLFGICLRILGDRSEAEDALQDVYVSLWTNAGQFDARRASPISWLATFARNRSIDRMRRSGRLRAAEPITAAEQVADAAPTAVAVLIEGEDSARIHSCLGQLEDRQRESIRAAFFEGFSYPELAARASIPLGTMKSLIRRGLARLKECLEQ